MGPRARPPCFHAAGWPMSWSWPSAQKTGRALSWRPSPFLATGPIAARQRCHLYGLRDRSAVRSTVVRPLNPGDPVGP